MYIFGTMYIFDANMYILGPNMYI